MFLGMGILWDIDGVPHPPSTIPKTISSNTHILYTSYEDISHPYLTGSLPPTPYGGTYTTYRGEGMGGREIRGTGDTEIGYGYTWNGRYIGRNPSILSYRYSLYVTWSN